MLQATNFISEIRESKKKKSLLVTFPRGIQDNSISVKDTECVITLNTIEHSVYDPQDNPVQIQD